jgi:hypothetical protein
MLNFYEYHSAYSLDNYDLYNEPIAFAINNNRFNWVNFDCKSIEHIIKKLLYEAYVYEYCIKDCRWPEAEPYILKSPLSACMYAINVLTERWPEAEPIISLSRDWGEYCRVFGIVR